MAEGHCDTGGIRNYLSIVHAMPPPRWLWSERPAEPEMVIPPCARCETAENVTCMLRADHAWYLRCASCGRVWSEPTSLNVETNRDRPPTNLIDDQAVPSIPRNGNCAAHQPMYCGTSVPRNTRGDDSSEMAGDRRCSANGGRAASGSRQRQERTVTEKREEATQMTGPPRNTDRRVAGRKNRRWGRRGGRRREDQLQSSSIATMTPCEACQVGTAVVTTFATDGEQGWLTYRCTDCDHQFRRLSE
jgi:transposase-like protein